ncbi:Cholesterol oxidase [Frondihabitans sp. 762G35]|uniref:GMC oxidoreductase n=1 Tax=Frondihabitans sp. 762G35 TaxID=1446794 RepID=UPI000D20E3FA|nr:GMC oxidoreductase [Frondihabitans sp. 762G35]ARC58455.1 Cholesterol oxidase [Frondihabitans sp. 762G35]
MTAPERLAETDLPTECEVAVVGSGFGAAVAAARLAPHVDRGGLVVLERGREWVPGDFPADFVSVRSAVRTRRNPLGLFDLSLGADMDSLVASGLGGGSLIYANVLLEPRPEVFATGWPGGIDSESLAPWFDRVREILRPEVSVDEQDARGGPRTVPGSLRGSGFDPAATSADVHGRAAEHRPRFAKVEALEALAAARGTTTTKVPVAINLTRPEGPNEHGVVQPRCTLCGNCMTGCNVGAKTTMRASYLPRAHADGARLVTGAEVTTVTPSSRPGRRWCLTGTRHVVRGGRVVPRRFELHCDVVVLGAGSLGTTGILLRSRDRGLDLSAALGDHFSGNGDSLAVAYNSSGRRTGLGARDAFAPEFETGPTITAMVDLRTSEGGHLVQDGAVPYGLAEALRRILGARFALQRDEKVWCDLRGNGCPPGCGALEHSQVWLAMGADGARGRITLDRRGRPRVAWRGSGHQRIFAEQARDVALLSENTEARLVANPRHALLGRGRPSYTPVTVHPLGGAVTADSVERGACDSRGRVFTGDGRVHAGLYVTDGALCPTSTGANPSLTIAALAERNVDHLIRDDLARLRAER